MTYKQRNTGCLIVILIFLALVVAISVYSVLNLGKMGGEDAAKVSAEEYQKIETGMTYEQVCEIIGGEGILQSENGNRDAADYEAVYLWDGESVFGSMATFTFRKGALAEKQQFGLK